jgi:hypothetical protein
MTMTFEEKVAATVLAVAALIGYLIATGFHF